MDEIQVRSKNSSRKFELNLLLIQGIALLTFYLLTLQEHSKPAMLITIGCWNIIVYSLVLYHEWSRQWLSPIIFYVGMALLRGGLCPIFMAFSIYDGETPIFMFYNVGQYIVEGTLLLNLEESLILGGYWIWRWRYWNDPELKKPTSYLVSQRCFLLSLFLYLMIVFLRIVDLYVFRVVITGKFLAFWVGHSAALAPMLLLVFTLQKEPKALKCKLLLWVIILLEVNNIIFYASKESFIVLLIPLVIWLLSMRQKGVGYKLKLAVYGGCILYLITMFIFPYVGALRSNSDKSASAFGGEQSQTYLDELEKDSFWRRNDWMGSASFSIQYVAENGFYGSYFIRQGILSMIPRIIWWKKPIYKPGEWMDSLLRTGSLNSYSTSATGLGLGAAAYFYGGILWVFFFCLANGMMIAFLERGVQRRCQYNPIAVILLVMLMVSILRHLESPLDCGIAGNFYYLCLLLVVYLTDPWFRHHFRPVEEQLPVELEE